MLTFVNGTDNRKAYTNSGVCVNPYSKTIIAENFEGTTTKINVKTTSHNHSYHIPLVPGSGSSVTYIDSTNGLKYNPGTKELYPTTNNVMNLGRSNAFFESMWIGNIYGAGIKSREIYSYIQYSDSSKPDTCLIKIATINCRTVTNNWDYDCIEIPVYIRHLRSVIYLELTIEHNGNVNPDKIELRYKGNLRSTIPSFYKGIKFWCTKVGSILTIWCEYGLDVKGGGSMNDPSVNIYNIKHHNYNITIDLPTTLTTYNGKLSEFKSSYTIYGAAPNNIEVANVNSSQTNFCHSIAVVSSSQYNSLTYKDPNTLYLII